jgi:hypothetical protein
MGEFIYGVAVREADAARVAEAFADYARAHGIDTATVGDPEWGDVTMCATTSGWTVLGWPDDAFGHERNAARALSASLGTVASTVSVYDGDYWTHVLFDRGEEVDRFASVPDYFAEDEAEADQLKREYAGNPAAVAAAVGVDVAQVAPYLTVVPEDDEELDAEEESMAAGRGRAFPDDEHDLDGTWVFVDFWRRLGIPYSGDGVGPTYGVDMGPDATWAERLPQDNEWKL